MESSKKSLNVDSSNVDLILAELLEENRQINASNTGLIEVANRLTGKVDGFEEKLATLKISTPEIDTRSIKEVIEKGFLDLRLLIDQKLTMVRESNWKAFWMSPHKMWLVYLVLGIVLLTYAFILFKEARD